MSERNEAQSQLAHIANGALRGLRDSFIVDGRSLPPALATTLLTTFAKVEAELRALAAKDERHRR